MEIDDGHLWFDPLEIEVGKFLNNKRKSREGTEDSPAITKVGSELHAQKVHKMGPTVVACSNENARDNNGQTSCLKQTSYNGADTADSDKTAKLRLFDICSTNKWYCPVYELCEEVGSNQNIIFRYKVTVLIDTYSLTILEVFSAPNCQRAAAQEHAAEGALWYLKHLGYYS